jgi:ribose 5-phosphate isomerase A
MQATVEAELTLRPGFQSKQLIIDAGLNLGDVDQYTRLDVCIDGADE